MSSPSAYMIVLIVFFKLLLQLPSTEPYLILKVPEVGGWEWTELK